MPTKKQPRTRALDLVEAVERAVQAIAAAAPPLSEDQKRELRPLLLAANVVTVHGKSHGRAGGGTVNAPMTGANAPTAAAARRRGAA